VRKEGFIKGTAASILCLSLFIFTQLVSAELVGWIAYYDGYHRLDQPRDLTVDSSGNVYVTGDTRIIESNYDYLTIKYDAYGNELWVAHYDGPLSDLDQAYALALDGDGNVYVTGRSRGLGGGGGEDIATIKYDPTGNQLWVVRYNGAADGYDLGLDIAVDSFGNVYVLGQTRGALNEDFITIKYDTNGNELWASIYDGPANGSDTPVSMARDADDNVYVLGTISTIPNPGYSSNRDFGLIKYDSNGNPLWVATYDGPVGTYEEATHLTLDGSGNIYVAGNSIGDGSSTDFATIKYDSNGNELWVARFDNAKDGTDTVKSLGVDALGNVYVEGESEELIDETTVISPATTIKYDANGTQTWMVRIPPSDMTIKNGTADSAGNVYVIGQGLGVEFGRWVLKKFDTNGNEVWTELVNGDYNSDPLVFADSDGDVCLTGYHQSDLVTISLNFGGASSFSVDFSAIPVTGAAPLTVTFTDLSGGSVDSWQWDFDYDGNVDSTAQNPTHVYSIPGVYSVSLQVSGSEGQGFRTKHNYISVGGPVISRIKNRTCMPGDIITIIGSGFGDTQGDSLIHIGNKIDYDSSSPLIKLWSDTKIRLKIKRPTRWFERKNGQKVRMWLAVDGVESNKKPIIPSY
jgi:hypothetical protein